MSEIEKFFYNLFHGNFSVSSDYAYTHQYAATHDEEGNYTGTGNSFLKGFGNLGGLIDSLIAHYTRNTLTGAENEQNAFNANEAQKSRDFTEYMARNKYSMETESMQNAGVNPAMVYGQGSLVPTASNGATGQGSASAGGDLLGMIASLMKLPVEIQNLKADKDVKIATANEANANAKKAEAETEGTRNYNAWFQDTYELRKQGLELSNNLTATQERMIYKQMDVMEEEMKKIKTEAVRNIYAAMLDHANARKIAALLPYEIALTKAKTANEQAMAKLNAVNAAYQQGLIDNGYLEAICDKAKSEARSAEAKAKVDEIQSSIRDGSFGEMEFTGNWLLDIGVGLNNDLNDVLAGLVLFMDNLNPLAGLLGGK